MDRKTIEVQGGGTSRRLLVLACVLMLSLVLAGPAAAQKKKKKDDTPPPVPAAPMPDEQKIDFVIGQMLGAWQVGDTTMMHKFYAEDVSVVAGTWTPPAIDRSHRTS